jgi:hypothetical protein
MSNIVSSQKLKRWISFCSSVSIYIVQNVPLKVATDRLIEFLLENKSGIKLSILFPTFVQESPERAEAFLMALIGKKPLTGIWNGLLAYCTRNGIPLGLEMVYRMPVY